MPRLNSLGSALMGVAGGQTSIDGTLVPSLSGATGAGWDWLTDLIIIGQTNLNLGAGLGIYQVIVSPDTLSLVVAAGANNIQAGGGVWEKWWSNGVTTNVVAVPSLPNAGPGSVDRDGTWAVCTVYATGSGITVYSSTGTVLQQVNVSLKGTIRLRDGWLTYDTTQGWPLVNSQTGAPLSSYVQQQNITGLIPVGSGSIPAVVEFNAMTAQWSIRRANSGTGLLLPIDANMFGVDAVELADGTVRLAWSTGAGELPAELVVLDVDTATRETQLGTVVAGSVVFTTGPTLEGSRFSMASAPKGYPPYPQKALDTDGRFTLPWQAYFNQTSASVAGLATAGASASPPTPPSTFQAPVLVSDTMGAAGFPQARLVQDSATVRWDFTAPSVATANAVAGSDARATMLTIASLRA